MAWIGWFGGFLSRPGLGGEFAFCQPAWWVAEENLYRFQLCAVKRQQLGVAETRFGMGGVGDAHMLSLIHI